MTGSKRLARDWITLCLLVLAGIALLPTSGLAHEIRPALLNITEDEPGWFTVIWKVPVKDGVVLPVSAVLPEGLSPVGPPSVANTPAAIVESRSYKAGDGSIVGGTIHIEGLSANQVDVLVQISLADGTTHSAILKPKSPDYTVPAKAGSWEVARSYVVMGVEHILSGVDHLLFVLALILIIGDRWTLLKAITAFTIAHSVTLALATLDVVHVPSAPTEAVIALSILFLAVEIVRKRDGDIGITERAPWIVAFIFGLVHGLGFAGALSDVGLPQHAIPLALFSFNVGVEIGQLMFVAVVLPVIYLITRAPIPWPKGSWRLMPYAVGGVAAYWTIERVGAFL